MHPISSSTWWIGPVFVATIVGLFVWLLTIRPKVGPDNSSTRTDVAGLIRRRKGGRAQRLAERRWIDGLIGELTVGRDPAGALVIATGSSHPKVAYDAWVAARMGGDVAVALMNDRSELVRSVGACWQVASNSGAGLVKSLTSISESARERERMRQQVDVAVAEPRAAALVVAVLPVIGLGMGSLLGANPLGWLMYTTVGRLMLLGAITLEALGCWWSWHIIRSVAEPT